MCLQEGRMEVWEAKGKGHCGVQKLPNFDLAPPPLQPQHLQQSLNAGLTLVCSPRGRPGG